MKQSNKPLHILQLPSWYLPEGGYFCTDQTKALKARGMEVRILANVTLPWRKYKTNVFKYPVKSFITKENEIEILRYYSWRIPYFHMINIKKWIHKTTSLVESYIQIFGRPDVIHVHSSMWGSIPAAKIKKKYGIPYVLTEHRGIFGQQSEFAKDKIKEIYTPFYIEGFSNASYILPVSEQQIEKISSFLTRDVPIRAMSNMLDVDFFSPENKMPENKKDFIFFAANSYNPVKAYDILLPAFDKVCEINNNVRLRIAGRYFDNPNFQELLKKCNHSDKISFCGFLSHAEIREELKKADGFVLSSRVEAQPVSFLEALSMGVPVVCTEVVPLGTFEDFCGYRVPIEDIDSLAQGMLNLIDNRRNFDSVKIRSHLKNLASPDIIAKKLELIYREIISEKY
ncbi:MAG: glycosyltransferase family 4 protein [Candidatus Azobacteroides sp.]|nr:glycosyltransferase family 4 protein [Candidatus Azobacteroides sp.]